MPFVKLLDKRRAKNSGQRYNCGILSFSSYTLLLRFKEQEIAGSLGFLLLWLLILGTSVMILIEVPWINAFIVCYWNL